MKEYDITKLPFTSISRENWEMLLELDKDSLYDVMQKVGNYVLTGERCDCDNTLSKIVCNQLISVIDRKGEAYCKTTGNLKPREKKTEENKQQPKQEPQPTPKPQPEPTPQPAPEPTMDDDAIFEDFFYDRSMDYSSLLTNVSYFKERKKDELNRLYQSLGKRYTGDQIIQILQDKWTERINHAESPNETI